MAAATGGGAQKAQRAQRSSLQSLVQMFAQPVAMGVLLGQGWHVYSEVYHRGTAASFGVCCAGALLGLLVGHVLAQRAAPGQAALRLSLFWMSCTLNGGLSGIAQLRLRIGRFRANDDALVVNSFLSSGLLGTALPYIAVKLVKQPGAEVLLPCIFAVLLTEAVCSSETVPTMQVVVSFFLLAVGLQGITSDVSLPQGSSEAARSIERQSSSASANTSQGHANHEPFRPATAIDKRSYSPHFLVSRKLHSVPNGTSVVPLISLVARQSSEPSRGGGSGKGGGKDRGKESRSSKNRASNDEVVQSLISQPRGAVSGATDPEEVVRQKGSVSVAEVGSDIRWDVLLEEMQRVDGKALPSEQPSRTSTERRHSEDTALDGPVEVFAELSAEGVAEDGDWDGEELGTSKADQTKVPEVELTMQQRWEQALAHARELEGSSESNRDLRSSGQEDSEVLRLGGVDSIVDPTKASSKLLVGSTENEDNELPYEMRSAPHDEEHPRACSELHLEKRETGHQRGDRETKAGPSSGLRLIELNGDASLHNVSDDREYAEDDLNLQLDDDGLRPLSPLVAMELSASASAPWNARAQEFVPVVEAETSGSKAKLRADAQEFQPSGATEGLVGNSSLSLFADDCVPVSSTEALATDSSLSLFADDCVPVTSPPVEGGGTEGAEEEAYTDMGYAQATTWPQDMEWDPSHAATYASDSWDKPWDGQYFGGDGTGAWDGYGAYGDVNQDYSAYAYEASGMTTDGYMNMSMDAPEYANMWNGPAVAPQEESTSRGSQLNEQPQTATPSESEPVMSLFEEEAPDPGCGRASTVRRQDTFEERKGKGKSSWTSREAQQRTLWVGDVDARLSEASILEEFQAMALVTGVKVFRDRTGYGDNKTGYAFVEFASQSAAVGVLEALKGEPLVTKDSWRLRVNWATPSDRSENRGGDHEAWNSERSEAGKGSDGKGGDRRIRRDRDKGDGKGYHDEAYRENALGGKGDNRKGKGKGRGGDDIDGPSDRSRARTDARQDGRPGWNESGSDAGNARWAYVDPHGEVQVGFSSEEMRTWYELGYFEPDMLVAILPDGGALALEGRKPKAPPRREFYKLRQWFRNLDKSFTYLPKF